jgi:hypothetical protein
MALIKSTRFTQPFNSNYRTIEECTLLRSSNKLNVVIRWFISEEQRKSEWLTANSDFKVFYFDTEKKYKQVEKMKIVQDPIWDLVSPAEYNDDWSIKKEAVYENIRFIDREVGTWEFYEVWENELNYAEIPEQWVSFGFCYDLIKKTNEFAWSDDDK